MSGRVIAIDGPAASGKSTAARGVARQLGFVHLNSGLFYRAITWAALERGWDTEALPAGGVEVLSIEPERAGIGIALRVDGHDPGAELSGPGVTSHVSSVASDPCVRSVVLEYLRGAADQFDLVCDGRDIGTAVFPEADLKVFLVAAPEERARRRLLERGEEPTEVRVADEAERLRERDRVDSTRAHDPLRQAEDAVALDTTRLEVKEVVQRIVELARAAGLGKNGSGTRFGAPARS